MLQQACPLAKQTSQEMVRERQEMTGIYYPQQRAAAKAAD